MDFISLINSVGFPIACVCACGWFIYTNDKKNREENKGREDRLLDNNEKLAVALNNSATAIVEATKINSEVYEKVNDVDGKVDKILSKMEVNINK